MTKLADCPVRWMGEDCDGLMGYREECGTCPKYLRQKKVTKVEWRSEEMKVELEVV